MASSFEQCALPGRTGLVPRGWALLSTQSWFCFLERPGLWSGSNLLHHKCKFPLHKLVGYIWFTKFFTWHSGTAIWTLLADPSLAQWINISSDYQCSNLRVSSPMLICHFCDLRLSVWTFLAPYTWDLRYAAFFLLSEQIFWARKLQIENHGEF